MLSCESWQAWLECAFSSFPAGRGLVAVVVVAQNMPEELEQTGEPEKPEEPEEVEQVGNHCDGRDQGLLEPMGFLSARGWAEQAVESGFVKLAFSAGRKTRISAKAC